MTRTSSVGLLLAALVVAAAAWQHYGARQFERIYAGAVAPASGPAPSPPRVGPPPADTGGEPLPPMDRSDEPLLVALGGVFGRGPVKAYFDPERVIPKIVATVDGLDREGASLRNRAIANVPGKFRVQSSGGGMVLAPDNATRYQPLLVALKAADAKAIVAVYRHWYPLFQQAYRELGYPDREFNDRLLEVIDHLMKAPDASGPVKLLRPNVLYTYADPDLEARSSGHKLMLRLGPAGEAEVKGKLNEIRILLAARG